MKIVFPPFRKSRTGRAICDHRWGQPEYWLLNTLHRWWIFSICHCEHCIGKLLVIDINKAAK